MPVFSALRALFVGLLAVSVAACAEVPPYFKTADTVEPSPQYAQELEHHTRKVQLYRELDTQLLAAATLRTPRFQKAYQQEWARVFHLSPAEQSAQAASPLEAARVASAARDAGTAREADAARQTRAADAAKDPSAVNAAREANAVKDANAANAAKDANAARDALTARDASSEPGTIEVLIWLSSSEPKLASLEPRDNYWRLKLVDSAGHAAAPSDVTLLRRPTPVDEHFFPYISQFGRVYRVTFPDHPEGAGPFASSSSLRLQFAGVLGEAEMSWEIDSEGKAAAR